MKFLSAVTLSLALLSPSVFAEEQQRRLRQAQGGNGVGVGRPTEGGDRNPGNGVGVGGGAGGPPSFLDGDDLPPGLVDNPSGVVGVDFKPGRKPKVQRNPKFINGKSQIRGIDDKVFELDLTVAERINVYSPEQFVESADGTSVTNIETGETIPLLYFFQQDEKNGMDITFVAEEDGTIINARAKPKFVEEEDGALASKIQHFQAIPGTDVLAAYADDDLDLSKAPSYGEEEFDRNSEKTLPPEFLEKLNGGGRALYASDFKDDLTNEQQGEGDPRDATRRTQAGYSVTLFGKTCTSWDWLDVRITTDRLFANAYPSHQSRAQAIVAEAAEIYWNESCVRLYIWSYSHTYGNSDWNLKLSSTAVYPWDSYISGMPSGCGSTYGGLNFMRDIAKRNFVGNYRDAWHMFTGANFSDAAGCAYVNACKSEEFGYGVNKMTWTTNLRYQAGTFLALKMVIIWLRKQILHKI